MTSISKRSATCEPFRSWNRLEPRPRKPEFDRVLRAGIHDPLWMLTRQWQFGEFKGEDTGSAVFAKVQLETTRVTRFRNDETAVELDNNAIPLEARVERMPVRYDLRFRARAGQYWLQLLDKFGIAYPGLGPGETPYADAKADLKAMLISLYPFEIPEINDVDPVALKVAKSRVLADKQTHQTLSALSGRALDGIAFFEALTSGGVAAMPAEITADPTYAAYGGYFDALLVTDAGAAFVDWMAAHHLTPDTEEDISWEPANLEYKFSTSLPNKGDVENTVLDADEYYNGHLDWFSFNHNLLAEEGSGLFGQDPAEEATHVTTEVKTIIPAEARFGGMPNSRWWEFEDGYMDLGNVTADTTDIAKIMLTEFALVYSNDWFVIPYTVPAGSLSEVKGIIVTDTFGERTWVGPAAQGNSNDWVSWTMFNLSKTPSSESITGPKVDPRIYVPAVAAKVHESEPLEKVEIIRDEMANMVWGVETLIPDQMGAGRDGNAAAQELRSYLEQYDKQNTPPVESVIPEGVKLKYQLGNTVPENWIPFLPIHLPGQNRAIQLQRASMPRWFDGAFSPIRPITDILREGMNASDTHAESPWVNADAEEQLTPYFVYEEETPKSGVTLTSTWQRTRWYNGKTVCWYGRKKQVARGEGASGLAFDSVIDVDYENQRALEPAETP